MRALVVFESMFGNTKEIAEAIAGELGRIMELKTVQVNDSLDIPHALA